jgi:murein DD-endopeptidase MepM/ murein hydrolase activator NlpD
MDSSLPGNLGKLSLPNTLTQKTESLGLRLGGPSASERRSVAQEFASFLYLEVLKAMRAPMPQEGLLETESLSRDSYTSMMDTEIARLMAKREGSGFSKTVEQSLDRISDKLRERSERPMPSQGEVSSGFGPRSDPFHGKTTFHNGVDIAAPSGSPVKVPTAGHVVFSGHTAGYGNMVEVDHGNGLVSRYAHNSVNLVATGEEVSTGQAIALVGSTGRVTGPHLHFEVRRQGQPVDPRFLLGMSVQKGTRVSSII